MTPQCGKAASTTTITIANSPTRLSLIELVLSAAFALSLFNCQELSSINAPILFSCPFSDVDDSPGSPACQSPWIAHQPVAFVYIWEKRHGFLKEGFIRIQVNRFLSVVSLIVVLLPSIALISLLQCLASPGLCVCSIDLLSSFSCLFFKR